jgi:hypothetical protein
MWAPDSAWEPAPSGWGHPHRYQAGEGEHACGHKMPSWVHGL